MPQRTWLITGVSSGFGRELTDQLLKRRDRVVGTVRDTGKVADLLERYHETFRAEVLDVTDTAAIREIVGDDPVEFVEALVANYTKGGYVTRERERLTRDIARAAGEDAGDAGVSR